MNRQKRSDPLVVVADDDDEQRFLYRESLEVAGFEVVEATDGSSALERVGDVKPDVVILDVVMSPVDGFTACAQLRAMPEGADLPVLMITGLDDTESIERAYEVGATDFLAKPINWALLGHRVRYMHRASIALNDLRASQRQLAEAQHIACLGSWELVDDEQIVCSREALALFGLETQETITLADILRRVLPDDRDQFQYIVQGALRARREIDTEFRVMRSGGSERIIIARARPAAPDESQSVHLFGTFQDITERRQDEARIQHLAHHDALTDIPNRALFQDRLENAVARAKRDGTMVGVLCLDIDRFKEINDTLGHAVGDQLLQGVAKRLNEIVRGSDTVARLGGDEFSIIQVGVQQPHGVKSLAGRLRASFLQPFFIGGNDVRVGTSLGVALYPTNGEDPSQLLVNADVALYCAKADGRGACRFFDRSMDAALRERREIEQDLRSGLAEGWFELHYQPQVRLEDDTLVGAEALIRLRHPEKGLMMPADFISIAEETGLIIPIGEWVLRTACEQAMARRDAQPTPIRVGVNLSVAQFRQEDLVERVEQILAEVGLDPTLLELEITESILMRDTTKALDVLNRLRTLGIQVAMDDFGTGYSSLNNLQLFPFDRIKIDHSFVRQLSSNPDAAAIVRAVVALGRSLNISTTAEGVETAGELAYLKGENCHEVQGYFFGRPVPAGKFSAHFNRDLASPEPVSKVG